MNNLTNEDVDINDIESVDDEFSDFDGAAFDDALSKLDISDNEDSVDESDAVEPSSKADTKAAVGMVEVGFVVSESLISGVTGLEFKYEEGAKQSVLESLEPLIDKYGLSWLGWFDKYKEEIMFAVAFGGLAFTSWMQLGKLKKEKIAELNAAEQEKRMDVVRQKEAELEQAKKQTKH